MDKKDKNILDSLVDQKVDEAISVLKLPRRAPIRSYPVEVKVHRDTRSVTVKKRKKSRQKNKAAKMQRRKNR